MSRVTIVRQFGVMQTPAGQRPCRSPPTRPTVRSIPVSPQSIDSPTGWTRTEQTTKRNLCRGLSRYVLLARHLDMRAPTEVSRNRRYAALNCCLGLTLNAAHLR
jgi:hypothetical protein